jgi:hypothetical protein
LPEAAALNFGHLMRLPSLARGQGQLGAEDLQQETGLEPDVRLLVHVNPGRLPSAQLQCDIGPRCRRIHPCACAGTRFAERFTQGTTSGSHAQPPGGGCHPARWVQTRTGGRGTPLPGECTMNDTPILEAEAAVTTAIRAPLCCKMAIARAAQPRTTLSNVALSAPFSAERISSRKKRPG